MKRLKKKKKIIFLVLGALFLVSVLLVFMANWQIERETKGLVYRDISEIPHNKVGLLLGTSKSNKSGTPNGYFVNRIAAAVALYNAGKIDYIVVSGDNRIKGYNEPEDMKNDLVKAGIPEEKIILDYAGFRTYDSVVRLNKVFGQSCFTVISQEFHNQRAIYIAKSLGLQAVGFNAKDVNAYNGFKTKLREKLARVKVFVDLMIDKDPKFLGEKIEIGN